MSRQRVIVLPGWYPTEAKPYRGIFFREQAELLGASFDVRVCSWGVHVVPKRQIGSWLGQYLRGETVDARTGQASETLRESFLELRVPSRRRFNIANALSRAIEKHCRDLSWRPDIVHAHCAISAGLVALHLARRFNARLVVTEHQHVIFDYFSHSDWENAIGVYSAANIVLAVSEFHRQTMLMNGVRRVDGVVGNLVDDAVFKIHPDKQSLGRPLIVTVGFNNRLKSHRCFLKAIEWLYTLTPEFDAVLVVPELNESGRAELEAYIDSDCIRKNLIFLEGATRSELVALYNRATVFVSASIAETFGVAACEALMCGCPVVATDCGGVREFVRDKENGLLVRTESPKDLAYAIFQVLSGRKIFDRATLRESVQCKFGRDAFLKRMSTYYAEPSAAHSGQ